MRAVELTRDIISYLDRQPHLQECTLLQLTPKPFSVEMVLKHPRNYTMLLKVSYRELKCFATNKSCRSCSRHNNLCDISKEFYMED